MKKTFNLLFIGDIIGEPGYNLTKTLLPGLISKHKIDFVVANAENISGGAGILEKDARKLLELPVNVITGGNHTMDKIQSHKFINESSNILRPLNYPRGAYGNGYGMYETNSNDFKIAIVNLQGRVFMKPIDCPFRSFDWVYEKLKEQTNIIIVDFHAEATAEKNAFGWYCDGRASAVIGTHTHIQTSDGRILPNGTAYITDAGMTGSYDSVIGMKKEVSIKRFIYATPQKHEIGTEDLHISGVICEINTENGKSVSLTPLFYPEF